MEHLLIIKIGSKLKFNSGYIKKLKEEINEKLNEI